MSLLQLLIDCALQADWSGKNRVVWKPSESFIDRLLGLLGNPVKLGLSNTSLFFDTIFMTQHYMSVYPLQPDTLLIVIYSLYRQREEPPLDAERDGEHEPLL
jgi:hypothetical protein